ncbi:type II toxin-antitoxin system RelE/ParE family toxin [Actinomadura rupiterrae]|uniref:type II toxin-antitoxin system RelE/ParE family toxin n=1 Tax=Actinomadura rupiterrae TaxID=559627 RepID=UPI0020A24BE2|nr:type II toxin-antitoxin system RelE/ParE family toxin [Actinomadura rupiterrae]MCP2340061.1 hypothetical protein [Actinomadura rupiterrae]
MEEWEIRVTHEWRRWFDGQDASTRRQIIWSLDRLAEGGPVLGRPMVDRIEGSRIHNLKELRPGSAGNSEIRILFAFDPWRSAIMLVGGDKSGDWSGWYRRMIPQAEELFGQYLKERQAEKEGRE